MPKYVKILIIIVITIKRVNNETDVKSEGRGQFGRLNGKLILKWIFYIYIW